RGQQEGRPQRQRHFRNVVAAVVDQGRRDGNQDCRGVSRGRADRRDEQQRRERQQDAGRRRRGAQGGFREAGIRGPAGQVGGNPGEVGEHRPVILARIVRIGPGGEQGAELVGEDRLIGVHRPPVQQGQTKSGGGQQQGAHGGAVDGAGSAHFTGGRYTRIART